MEHFEVVGGAHFEALGFEEFVLFLEFFEALGEFGFDALDGLFHALFAGYVVGGGEDVDVVGLVDYVAGDGVEGG